MALELVVGIDFGTTYSGVSWIVNGGTKELNLVNDWPNPKGWNTNTEKVPTIISYKNGKPYNWGYEVDIINEVSVSWFKLLLDPSQRARGDPRALEVCRRTLEDLGKSAEDVATDYFRCIWQYTKEAIEEKKGTSWESTYTLKLVITVPAIWSQIAKEATLNAARRAGLPTDILLVTEPEAAALAVLKAKDKEPDELHLQDSFVICDAGGGTVDLITYKITKLNPLQIEEGVVGEGDGCGSVHLDIAFEKYIQMVVGEKQYSSLDPKAKATMLHGYETGLKRAYSGTNKEYSVELHGVDDNEKEGIDSGTITLKPQVLRTLFDHVINQIVGLVKNQVDEAQMNDQRAILLVGGFGSNKYLHKRLKDAHENDGIDVLKVMNGWSSICRGAATWGLEHSSSNPLNRRTVAARKARFNYGNCWCVPFDASKGHLEIDKGRLPDPNHEWWAMNQMEWILKKAYFSPLKVGQFH
ncbi:actin-like ATPase domain-containing protein [Corynespora cassiicola Philippines]|uniref:Actin-like ATPase domain-containing protein n=1 Tax=Corynespora cassiicola Philippines TaxID=1448308 RepID=A0A2T2N009_CORCC|nr:actin-like ATPase domain-containing protein [Corynespora cassiicola Philippines]PSN58762.1 actin-like ATPase domain-containing protein [Corynespora cassiicola Philippines]